VVVIEIRNAELMETVTKEAQRQGILNGAIVSLIGAVDSFTISTMPKHDASKDVLTEYAMPAEMTGTGEIVDGTVHIHTVMAVEGDRGVTGHLHRAEVGSWFARVYVLSADS
jgi:predicted DNA-binding protein with PD1-like motif